MKTAEAVSQLMDSRRFSGQKYPFGRNAKCETTNVQSIRDSHIYSEGMEFDHHNSVKTANKLHYMQLETVTPFSAKFSDVNSSSQYANEEFLSSYSYLRHFLISTMVSDTKAAEALLKSKGMFS